MTVKTTPVCALKPVPCMVMVWPALAEAKAALAAVLRIVPLGAAVLAGSAVALVVLGYLAIYLLVFLPRGVVG